MKLSNISTNTGWKSLAFAHQHDKVLNVNDSTDFVTSDGFKIDICSLQKHTKHTTSDKYTNYMLTDDTMVSDLFNVETSVSKYPDEFTTSLLVDAYPNRLPGSAFVRIIETDQTDTGRDFIVGQDGDDFTYIWSQDITQNEIYFVVKLHDEYSLSISHDDNFANVFLTYSGDPNSGTLNVSFEQAHLDVPGDNQRFGYYINRSGGFMLLYVEVEGTKYYVCPDVVSGKTFKTLDSRSLRNVSHPRDYVISIDNSSRLTDNQFQINNNWVSYSTVGNTNNLNIDTSKSIENITNNTLVAVDLQNIQDGKMLFNTVTLKNQITYTGEQNKNNPFPNFRACDHRDYDKIFLDDSHDINDGLFLGYNSYEYEIRLPVDQITYFNTPQDMYPYERINVNDSNLIQNGAVGGDSPMAADKIFKKAASYKYNTPYGKPTDEESGTWLCSWLRSSVAAQWQADRQYNENIFVEFDGTIFKSVQESINKPPNLWPDSWEQTELPPPTWVDRYYNPKMYSAVEALSFENPYTSYTTKFDFIIKTLRAEDNYIFDKKSDLTFEPGSLYAYHHIGKSHIDDVVKSINTNVIHDGLTPLYDTSNDVVNNINDTVRFDGDQYIVTNAPASVRSGDFTLSFDISAQNWQDVFGTQILGNYTNEGVGVFNRLDVTNYIYIRDNNKLNVYNTEMLLLYDLEVDEPIISYTKQTGNENIIIYTSLSAITFDMNGTLLEATPLTDLADKQVVDGCVTEDYYYTLLNDDSVIRQDINTEQIDLLYTTPIPVHVIGMQQDIGIVSNNTYIQPIHDREDIQYRINADDYTIDSNNDVWFIKQNYVYRESMSDINGAPATWEGFIDEIRVLLIAENGANGFVSNQIEFVGDGKTTLFGLINNWNEQHNDNRVNLVEGLATVIPDSGFEIKLSGGRDQGQSVLAQSFSASDTTQLQNITCDYDDNVYILYDTKIIKTNNIRKYRGEFNITQAIPNITSIDQMCMDMLVLLDRTDVKQVIALLVRVDQSQEDVHFIKINSEDMMLIENKVVSIPVSVDLNNNINFTQFENYKQLEKPAIYNNTLTFKLRFKSYFDSDKTHVKKLKYTTDNLSPGSHSFIFAFNGSNSNLALFVDGLLVQTGVATDDTTGAAYKFTPTINTPLTVGAECTFNNITLAERVKIPGLNFTKNCTLQSIKVYDKYITFQKINLLSKQHKNLKDISLTLPAGKRNYIEHADAFYKHREPGSRSNSFELFIANQSLSSTDTQMVLNDLIFDEIQSQLPINSQLNKINWIS